MSANRVALLSGLLILIAFLVAGCGAYLSAQSDPDRISGRVPISEQDDPIPEATPSHAISPGDQEVIGLINAFPASSFPPIEHQSTELVINSPRADVVVDMYVDASGGKFGVDRSSELIVEYSAPALLTSVQERLTQDELRVIAQRNYSSHCTAPACYVETLSYEEGEKAQENYFFRWQFNGLADALNPPVFQIGLRADGLLMHYLNTLSYD